MTKEQLWVRTLQYVTDQGVPAGERFKVAKKVYDTMAFLVKPPVEPSAAPSFVGLKLVTVVDGSVPADTIEFRASDGRVLGQIRQLATTSKAKATRITFVTGGEVPDGCLCWTSEGVLFSPAPDCPIHAERTA